MPSPPARTRSTSSRSTCPSGRKRCTRAARRGSAAAPEPRVDVLLLGGFAAAVDGEPVPANAWRLSKARDLVKLLALARGNRLHREQVIDALWGDRDLA